MLRESALPGLATWRRVADYRVGQLQKLTNVNAFTQSALTAAQVLEFAAELTAAHVVIATGAQWDDTGVGRAHRAPLQLAGVNVVTPDAVMDGAKFSGDVLIYDDDHYYIGGVIAEKIAQDGGNVTLVTPANEVSEWTRNTLEQAHIERRLRALGVDIIEKHTVTGASDSDNAVTLQHTGSGESMTVTVDTLVLVTARRPCEELFLALDAQTDARAAGIRSVSRIGDCLAPATIAAAVYDGHRYARELDCEPHADAIPFKRERVEI